MAEFRQDPLSLGWVIIAEDRGRRPSEFSHQPARRANGQCPFCPDHESETPEAVATYPADLPVTHGNWKVRVIPNKYPAAQFDAVPAASMAPAESQDTPSGTPFQRIKIASEGVHQVVVESPEHVASLTELSDEQAILVMNVYRDRFQALGADSRVNHCIIFKNCRGRGGATLEHVHSQVLATSFIPPEIERDARRAAMYFDQLGRCYFCALLDDERSSGVRIVAETERLIALCPFASRFPYETWIFPRRHACRFEQSDSNTLAELGKLVRTVLSGFERLQDDCAYNYWIHSAPLHVPCFDSFHWHLRLIPRVTTQGGYEWGTGCFVNPVSPENAARTLRE